MVINNKTRSPGISTSTINCCNSCTFLIDSQIVIIFPIIMCVFLLSGMLAYPKSFSHYPYSVMVKEELYALGASSN